MTQACIQQQQLKLRLHQAWAAQGSNNLNTPHPPRQAPRPRQVQQGVVCHPTRMQHAGGVKAQLLLLLLLSSTPRPHPLLLLQQQQ